MRRMILLAMLLLGGARDAARPEGSWVGEAVIGGEARSLSIEIVPAGDGWAGRYSIPSLALESMPVRLRLDPASGEIRAARGFSAVQRGDALSGEIMPAFMHRTATMRLARAGAPTRVRTRERAVSFTSRGAVLSGTLVAPLRSGRFAALVSLHGSGPSARWLALGRARRFAEAGYVTLIWDKPGTGQSGGDWTMTSLDEMAADAIAALEFLRGQPEVDAGQVGLWGHSQAGWVISRAAALSDRIAFAIVLAGGGTPSREVEDYGYRGRLRHGGASARETSEALAWVNDYYDYVRTGAGYDVLAARLAGASWRRALGVSTIYPTPEQQPKWAWVATYDPAEDIRRMRMPVLLLFAGADRNTPTERSLALWREGLSAAGNTRVDAHLFPGADHHFLVEGGAGWPSIAPDYFELQFAWLRRIVPRRHGRRAGTP